MREHIREEPLALYAGGDLPPRENSAVAAHLEGCDECRKALAEFQEARSFVTAALQNPSIDELSAVHKGVVTELQAEKSHEKHWAWWTVGAAAALALCVLPHRFEKRPVVTLKTEPVITASAIPTKIPAKPLRNVPLLRTAVFRSRHLPTQKAGVRTITLISQADRDPVLEMTTADPNVIILWQTNKGTGQEP